MLEGSSKPQDSQHPTIRPSSTKDLLTPQQLKLRLRHIFSTSWRYFIPTAFFFQGIQELKAIKGSVTHQAPSQHNYKYFLHMKGAEYAHQYHHVVSNYILKLYVR